MRHEFIDELGDLGFVGVADDPGDAGECGELFGGALGVAAGDNDASGGICGVEFSNGAAGLGVRGGGYCASVDDDYVGAGGFGRGSEASFEELAFEGGAIGLSGAAAELFDVKGVHFGRNQMLLNTEDAEFAEKRRKCGSWAARLALRQK
jgi:hypothetical protein